jgi:hypothetical protein
MVSWLVLMLVMSTWPFWASKCMLVVDENLKAARTDSYEIMFTEQLDEETTVPNTINYHG